MRVVQIITQFKEQGINTKLNVDENKRMQETYSIAPISAKSGEGFGTTIDVVSVNGVLRRGDQIVVCGNQGTPIVTRIQSLLTPEPMKELRVMGKYQHHSEIRAAQAIKITAPQALEHAIAGNALYVVGPNDDLEEVKEAPMEDMMKSVLVDNKKSSSSSSSAGVGGVSVPSIYSRLFGSNSRVFEDPRSGYSVTPEAQKLADELGMKNFVGDIIHEVIKAYVNNVNEEKEKELATADNEAVFPCVLKILPNCVFNKKDPIIVGVKVVQGIVKALRYDELVSHMAHISRRLIDVLKSSYRNDLSHEEWKLVLKLKTIFKIQ
ncbi:hypothetical protein M0R45_022751 [Rubus argutus]|uniref:Eukaryotic translation initiation factor 5B n=1 Tax=Rubus argutus TaxID=59490 RepID=A0AAW1XHB0_RUBAR